MLFHFHSVTFFSVEELTSIMEQSSFSPNAERIRQRQLEVVKAALRAKNFTEAELTAEAASLIKFCLSLNQKYQEIQIPEGEYEDD